jgi:toxin ParE1/3/4
MTRENFVSPQAEQDIATILRWTQQHFGKRGRLRYEALLVRAIIDITNDPARPGSHARPEIGDEVRTYHLRFSRDRVAKSVGRVQKPRHFILYRTQPVGLVEIGRILHDSVDLRRHLPDEYRTDG